MKAAATILQRESFFSLPFFAFERHADDIKDNKIFMRKITPSSCYLGFSSVHKRQRRFFAESKQNLWQERIIKRELHRIQRSRTEKSKKRAFIFENLDAEEYKLVCPACLKPNALITLKAGIITIV